MKRTYLYEAGQWVEAQRLDKASVAPMVMGDITPYQSMIDGTMIQSRSRHRDHLRDHGCIEVGNESMETRLAPIPSAERRELLRDQLATMSHAQANTLLRTLRHEARSHIPHRS